MIIALKICISSSMIIVLKIYICRFQDHSIKDLYLLVTRSWYYREVSLGSKIIVLKSCISRFQDHSIKIYISRLQDYGIKEQYL